MVGLVFTLFVLGVVVTIVWWKGHTHICSHDSVFCGRCMFFGTPQDDLDPVKSCQRDCVHSSNLVLIKKTPKGTTYGVKKSHVIINQNYDCSMFEEFGVGL